LLLKGFQKILGQHRLKPRYTSNFPILKYTYRSMSGRM
jgi:hypothetical protein